VFLPNWFTCCEVFPELPSIQGWVEAMTSLGRLIFFDQPGSGASDPVTPGALPTLEQWGDRHHRGVSFLRAAARSGTRPTGSVTGL
jgi:pimeloyl-ACP methyl ester carboxylesterase